MKPCRRETHHGGISLLGKLLGKDEKTVRRWVSQRPELRPVLRAKRNGKQWMIEIPSGATEREEYLNEVRAAVANFTSSPTRTDEWIRDFLDFLGVGEKRRDREVQVLRMALVIKQSGRELDESDEGEAARSREPSFALEDWEQPASDCWSTARMVSARYNCSVKEAPAHWRNFLEWQNQRNREHNAPQEAWLKEQGVYEKALSILEKHPWTLIVAYIGKPLQKGKVRVRLRRMPLDKGEDARCGWRVRRYSELIQLLPVKTEAQILAECRTMEALWPDDGSWRRAEKQWRRDWEQQTLAAAALELVRENRPVNGENLAPLVFRNPRVQDCWEIAERHAELTRQGVDVLPYESAYKYGVRGISVSEFRQRYSINEIRTARAAAIAGVGHAGRTEPQADKCAIYGEAREDLARKYDSSEKAPDDDMDESGAGELDEHGKPVWKGPSKRTPSRKEKEADDKDAQWRSKLNHDDELKSLAPEERSELEKALGMSIEAYIEKFPDEDFDLA